MFVCVAIQGRIIINNCLARVLEYCFSPHFCEWWNYAKQNYASSPTSLFSTPLWSTSSSFFSEFGVRLILSDQKITEIFGCFHGIIDYPWILTTRHYLLHFQCIHFFPMLFAEKLTVDELLNVLLSGPFFAPLFLECWFPKAGMRFLYIHLKHGYVFTVMGESLSQKDTAHNFRKILDCCYAWSYSALDLATNNSCLYAINMYCTYLVSISAFWLERLCHF